MMNSNMKKTNMDLLNKVFANIDLSKDEENSLRWLANYETSTIKNIISAFEKTNAK